MIQSRYALRKVPASKTVPSIERSAIRNGYFLFHQLGISDNVLANNDKQYYAATSPDALITPPQSSNDTSHPLESNEDIDDSNVHVCCNLSNINWHPYTVSYQEGPDQATSSTASSRTQRSDHRYSPSLRKHTRDRTPLSLQHLLSPHQNPRSPFTLHRRRKSQSRTQNNISTITGSSSWPMMLLRSRVDALLETLYRSPRMPTSLSLHLPPLYQP